MKTYKILLLLLLILIIGSCDSNNNKSYDNVDQMINDSQIGISKVMTNDFKTVLDHKEGYIIIDCRETEEYSEGHIPGAINIPRGILEFSGKISNRREAIYIYSQTTDRASLAYPTLKSLKYKEVYLIDGGWEEWLKMYPEIIELGLGTSEGKTPPKKEESSGCGG